MVFALFICFGLVAIAAVGKTIVMTLDVYPQLPAEVPYHFDGYGNPDSSGPKPMIFMMVLPQAIAIVVFGIVGTVMLRTPSLPTPIIGVGLSVCGVCIGLLDAQQGILNVALGKAERYANQWRPVGIILACVAMSVAIGVIFGR